MSCDSWQVVNHPHATAIWGFGIGVVMFMLYLVSLLVGKMISVSSSVCLLTLNPSHRHLSFIREMIPEKGSSIGGHEGC